MRDWRPAFEKAGFKNAIDARLAPTVEENPDFSIYDSTYPFISWKISGQNNAYGRLHANPGPVRLLLATSVFLQCLEFGTEMVFRPMWSQ